MAQAQLAFDTHGDPSRPALLLLHGFMSCRHQWLENIEALSRHRFLVNVELWGHGNSPTPADPALYSVAEYARQFEAIRAQLDIQRWAVAGQSYGAGVVINYALAHPQQISAIIVTNSRSAFGDLARPSDTGSAPRPDQRTSNPEPASPFDPRQLPYHPIHARRFAAPVKQALVEAADRITATAVRNGGLLGAELNCIEKLGQLSTPLLLTNGIFEKTFQTDLAKMRQRYPDLQVASLSGGHSVNIEASQAFNAAVIEFLEQTDPPR